MRVQRVHEEDRPSGHRDDGLPPATTSSLIAMPAAGSGLRRCWGWRWRIEASRMGCLSPPPGAKGLGPLVLPPRPSPHPRYRAWRNRQNHSSKLPNGPPHLQR
jgi:hypothetical protein